MRAESIDRYPPPVDEPALPHVQGTFLSIARRLTAITAAACIAVAGDVIATPGVGATAVTCDPGALVAALAAISGSGSSGTITLAAGCTYTIAAVNNTADGNNAFPDILGNVTLVGSGATITRPTSGAPNFRFFIVDDGGSLNISNLTLSNGSIPASDVHGGAAIFNRSQLTVNGVIFLNNVSLAGSGGGAVDNHDTGQMTITGSTFTGNVALQGGAIEDEATQCHTSRQACGQATVSQTSFTNNSTAQFGGGAFESQLDSGTLPLCQPAWPQPQPCQEPGGAHDTLIADTFNGNAAMTEGGGLANFGTTTVADSTFYNNSITGTGPSGDDGGGGIQNTGTLTVTQTTLSANSSLFGANIHDFNDSTHQPGPPVTSLRMSIVADGAPGSNCSGSVAVSDAGYNLDTGTSCGFSPSTGSLLSTNPQLGPLQGNGGPTQTMALPLSSPATDAIPGTAPGCPGSTDQRGISRPQGRGCDIGAFEVVQSSTDTQPPTVPTGLTKTAVGSGSVSLSWGASTDDVSVAGYSVYRGGVLIGSTGVTSFTDSTAAPSTTYSYTVDAFDPAGNHSAQSAPLSVTTTAASITYVQSATVATGGRVLTTTINLTTRVGAGDLLTGWFAQWDAPGQVQVADSLNGAWTRAQGMTYNTGRGDIALYYVANSKAAAGGLTITIGASAGTYLTGTVGEYAGAAVLSPLDKIAMAAGSGTSVDSGPTAAVPAGELVFGALTGNNSPGTVTPGTSQGLPFTVRSAFGDSGDADIVAGLAGAQDARFTIARSVNWYAVAAVFKVASPDASPPSVPTGLSATNAARSVTVGWSASTDDVGVAGYVVYRNGSALTTVGGSTLTFADTTVASVATYAYTVDAFDFAGNHSAQSASVTVTTLDWVPPTVPGGLGATAPTPTQVNLTWSASTDNVGVTGYTIYRNGSQLGMVGGSTLTFTDNTATGLTTYSYTVDAFDASGNHSAQSQPVSVTTPAPPDSIPPTVPGGLTATATSPTNVLVRWTASSDDVAVSGYDVFRDGSAVATVGASTLQFNDTVAAGSTHSYTVDAVDVGGNHSAPTAPVSVTTPASDTTPPTVPGGVAAVAVSSAAVSVSWNASTDNVAVAGYDVYRNGAILSTVSATTLSINDTAVSPATNYTYAVDAFDAAGNHSALSTAVAVHVPAQVAYKQSNVITTGSRVTSVTVTLGAVAAGDLLVGWFGQYDSAGQVQVADNVNGAWTRSASTTWNGATGDIALYYVAGAKAAPAGLTITVSSPSPTYIQAAAAEYSGVATAGSLDQVLVAKGTGTTADTGLTPAVQAGELVFGGFTATNGAGTLVPGTSQGVSFVKRAQSSSGTQGEEDIAGGAAGQQHASFSFPTSVPWFMVCATFKAA